MLLQKREENAITLAATANNAQNMLHVIEIFWLQLVQERGKHILWYLGLLFFVTKQQML